jgi:hypothetical protein
MYEADGKAATNDFLRVPKTAPEGAEDRSVGAGAEAEIVRMMRVLKPANSPDIPNNTTPEAENVKQSAAYNDETAKPSTRTQRTIRRPSTRTSRNPIEAISGEACPPGLAPTAFPVGPVPAVGSIVGGLGDDEPLSFSPLALPAFVENPEQVKKMACAADGGLFGDALPFAPTPQDRLRLTLREACRRRRGTQSRIAEALGLSPHTLANILAGRERFTPSAAAAIRRWLDGEALAGWPPLPEPENADAAA